MYKEFSIISIETVIEKKQIIIEANKAINDNSKENIVIDVYERATKTPLLFDYEIEYEKLIITLKEWPIPNTDYILGVTGITSVTDEVLESNIKKRLRFDSNVLSKVKIISPVMFEEIKSLDIKLQEVADDAKDLVGTFYLEVATDNAFYNIVNSTTLNKDSVTLALKQEGQHFIRARVQKDESNYSIWSAVISFLNGNLGFIDTPNGDDDPNHESIDIDVNIDDDDMEPIIDINEPLIITDLPEQGITPEEALLIAFNNYLDDSSIDSITIVRKDVR